MQELKLQWCKWEHRPECNHFWKCFLWDWSVVRQLIWEAHGKVGGGNIISPSGLKSVKYFDTYFICSALSVPEVIYSLLLSLSLFCLFSPLVPLLLSPLGFLLPDAASLLVSLSLTLYHTLANLWSIINVLQADRVFLISLTPTLPSLCFFKIPVCGSPESRSTHKSWGTVQHFSREARRHFQPGHYVL